MIKKTAVFALSLLLAVITALSCGFGCIGGSESSKRLTTYFGENTVVAARYYSFVGGIEDYEFEELDEDRIDELVTVLDSMKLKYHFAHTDYYWRGQFGIELEMEDGTFITYDGTLLEHRNASRKETDDSDHDIKDDFIEVTSCDFWKEMEAFFPSVANGHLLGSW